MLFLIDMNYVRPQFERRQEIYERIGIEQIEDARLHLDLEAHCQFLDFMDHFVVRPAQGYRQAVLE